MLYEWDIIHTETLIEILKLKYFNNFSNLKCFKSI